MYKSSFSDSSHNFILLFLALLACLINCDNEIFMSIGQLSKLKHTTTYYSKLIDEKLNETNEATRENFIELSKVLSEIKLTISDDHFTNFSENPVQAFKIIQQFVKINDWLKQSDTQIVICESCYTVNQRDLDGSIRALLRLQKFYNLKLEDLIAGRIFIESQQITIDPLKTNADYLKDAILNEEDCFLIGQTAFHLEDYETSQQWIELALNLNEAKMSDSDQKHSFKVSALEYLAFSAYKSDKIKLASQITKKWLGLKPDSTRAKKNLKFYLRTIRKETRGTMNIHHAYGDPNQNVKSYYVKAKIKPQHKQHHVDRWNKIGDIYESTVHELCLRDEISVHTTTNSNLECFKQTLFTNRNGKLRYSGYKVEILHQNPRIIRVHDFITDRESDLVIKSAFPDLSTSTVQNSGLTVQDSDYRIAKTAWLDKKKHLVVSTIETRIAEFLDLSLEKSEPFQVVNYGLGGFYGPHLDTDRSVKEEELAIRTDSYVYNRVLTFLIYLTDVEIGGSTVFPHLNLSTKTQKRSAVVWHNLHRNGQADYRVLHSSCPVLLGSKWIATKWMSEQANSFRRPCDLKNKIF